MNRPLKAVNKAMETLRKHADKEHHKAAIVRAEEFKKSMSHQQPNIQQRLSKSLSDRIANNRGKLKSIIKTIVLCGRQNIALRGHRDNTLDIERDATGVHNHGNFTALLNFRIDSGDTVLKEHLSAAARNSTYTSNTIQNQIITVLAKQVTTNIVNKVKAARWFTVIADEVADVSNREQLSIVLRYVDPATLTVREDLVGFFECATGTSGHELSSKIKTTLEGLGLDLTNLRGQAYDGAGNMAGSVNGTASLISSEYPLAIYCHCASHCLNLAVVKSLTVTSVRNMMGVIGRVYQFFAAHPKRQGALESAISQAQPSSKVHKLKDMCRTRWIQRIDAADVFKRLFTSIAACFDNITNDGPRLWSADSITDARGLYLAITTTEFVCALVITNASLKYIQALTSSLQAEAKDIVAAVKEVDIVTATIQDVRDHINTHHDEWFLTISDMLSEVGVEPSIPRRCGRQIHRNNTPAESPSEYYKRTISIPVIDHLLNELQSRFSNHQRIALLGLSLVPSLFVLLDPANCTSRVKELAGLYEDDLPSANCIASELHSWKIKWNEQLEKHGESSLPTNLSLTLRNLSSMYPNISALIKILCTLPVTSCTAERSFSGLKRIKTPFRSTMTNSRLTGLTLLHIHRDISIDIDAAIDDFARMYPRRMRMIEILEDSGTVGN